MLTQLCIVLDGVEELCLECDQQRPVQAWRLQEPFPGGSCFHGIGRPVEQRQ
jgi:hypothetical protein